MKIAPPMTESPLDPQYLTVTAAARAEPAPPCPAFSEVYRAHFRLIWTTLARLGVRTAELEDAAQEVFMVVHRRLEDYDPTRPLRPWLLGITYRVATAERRRARHRREHLGDAPRSQGIDRATPEAQIIARCRAERIHQALDALDPERRAVFVMHEMQAIPCPEIAEALGVPLNTIYSRLRVARERFRGAFDELRTDGGTP